MPQVGAAPLTIADAQDDDIDAVDALDEDLFPVFQEEADDLMPKLGSALREWVEAPDRRDARNEVLRVLHTLKGSARLAGAMRLGEMAHRMESSIEQIGSESLQSIQLEPLLTRFDTMQNVFTRLGAPPEVAETPTESTQTPHARPDANTVVPTLTNVVQLQTMPRGAVLAAPRPVANQSVRVRSQLLDRLVNQAGEVMISRARIDSRLTQLRSSLGELGGNLERLRHQLRDIELQSESQMQSRLAQTKDSAQAFDPLEFDRFTRVQELTRMMAESVHDVATVQRNLQRSVEGAEDDLIAQGRQARELQRDLLRTRMMEFEGVSDRLYAVVRQAAKEAGKQVKLDIVGGSIEMDRGVMERMAPAFEHMLRNAVAHGIESTADRISADKPAAGTITIKVDQESNDISVSFMDDGGGLHLERIRARAVKNGVIKESDVLSDGDAANLIFTPGFSTADQVTELAGRGIGMDVVRSEVNALGGRIETSTVPGQGTTFKLIMPLTTAVTQVVMLRMGDFTIAVPSNLVETVLRTPASVLEEAYQRDGFEVGGQMVPFFWSGALLQVSSQSHEAQTKTFSVVVLRSAGQRLVLHVDEVLGNREVVVKNLGPQLSRLPGLAGVSVLASGAVALIYNPVALASVYGEQARLLRQTALAAGAAAEASGQPAQGLVGAANQVPLILVVDDSITVRRVTQRLLKREGYRVALAADGLQALERLQEEKPTLVLSDIEMPRMDGFDLARNIRGDDHLKDLPIIMITSRIAGKHREHAKELGVDHYLGKPYSEDELLGLVRSYCDQPVTA
jgi:chemosensory pili system protein ChpA (sensor histidine kinase/response regulator)